MAFGGAHNAVTPLTFNIGPIDEPYCWHMGPLAVMPLLANSPPKELAGFMAAFKRTCASSGMLTDRNEVEFVQPFRTLEMHRPAELVHRQRVEQRRQQLRQQQRQQLRQQRRQQLSRQQLYEPPSAMSSSLLQSMPMPRAEQRRQQARRRVLDSRRGRRAPLGSRSGSYRGQA